MNFNKFKNQGIQGKAKITPPGSQTIGTINQWLPNNATDRSAPVNGTQLNNGLGSFPRTLNQGLQASQENIRLLADTFQDALASRQNWGYRQVFSKYTIPAHSGTLSMTFNKLMGIDDNPLNAALTGLTGWEQKWNEITMGGSSVEVSTQAYGRYYKRHAFQDFISTINWFEQMGRKFQTNAQDTMNNLAAIRMFEGSNKLFVSSVATFDPANPHAARITLGASAADVNAHLTLDSVLEAKFLMENYQEEYVNVDAQGAITTKKRKAVIRGFQGGDEYKVILGRNGYRQLLANGDFLKNFVANGGYAAQSVVDQTWGISNAVFGLRFELVDNPLTISKQAAPVVDTNGQGALECAFVVGGLMGGDVGIELELAGYTRLITVGYEEDKKIDPFGVFAMVGWMTVTDFTIINNEALYCIPYVKSTTVISGTPVAGKALVGDQEVKWTK